MIGTQPKTALRMAKFIRVSDIQGREDTLESDKEQLSTIDRFVAASGDTYEAVDTVMAIDQTSMKGAHFKTPEFQQLVSRIEAGQLDGILVYDYSRFGRSLSETVRMMDVIEEAGGYVVSATENLPGDWTGKMARNFFLVINDAAQQKIRAGWIATLDRKHEQGVVHGIVPVGYVKDGDKRLVPSPDAPHVSWAFSEAASGTPWADIAKGLCDRTGLNITPARLRFMLRNRVYLGEVRRGSRPVIKDAHDPIVDEATFEAAQRARTAPRRTGKNKRVLTGMVRCAGCRRLLQPRGPRLLYTCDNSKHAHKCPEPASIGVDRLEQYVLDGLRSRVQDVLYNAASLNADTDTMDRDAMEAEQDVRTWMQDTFAQRADRPAWESELNRRIEVRDLKVEAHRSALAKSAMPSLPNPISFDSWWESATLDERREGIAGALDTVFVRRRKDAKEPIGDRVKVLWYGEGAAYRKKWRTKGGEAPFTW